MLRVGLAVVAFVGGCLAVNVSASLAAKASSIERQLLKLDPEYRAQQACVIKGLDLAHSDARLRGADRIKTSAMSPAVLNGTLLTTKGAAVRMKSRWYALTFTCQLQPDFLKATSFAFQVGAEIPKGKWDDLGLWD